MDYHYPFRLQLNYTQPNGRKWITYSGLRSSLKQCQDEIYMNCTKDEVKNKDGQVWVILEGPPELWE